MFIGLGQGEVFQEFKDRRRLLPSDRWEVSEEIVKPLTSRQIVEQGLNRHTGMGKDWGAPENFLLTRNGLCLRHRNLRIWLHALYHCRSWWPFGPSPTRTGAEEAEAGMHLWMMLTCASGVLRA